jgi:hypothetical protein
VELQWKVGAVVRFISGLMIQVKANTYW